MRKERHQCTYTLNLAANFQDIKNVMTLKMWNVTHYLIQKVTILVMAGFDKQIKIWEDISSYNQNGALYIEINYLIKKKSTIF